jgi:tetratricopeptide (TPR) repeat protein
MYETAPADASAIAEGVRFAEAALARESDNAEALALRGILRHLRWSVALSSSPASRGLLDSAKADLIRATSINPRLAPAWNGLSSVLRMKGDIPGAVDAAHRAMAADAYFRDLPQVLNKLVYAYLFAGQNDSARVLCLSSLKRFPNDLNLSTCELAVLGWTGRGPADIARMHAIALEYDHSGTMPLVDGISPLPRFYYAGVLARSGMSDSARKVLRDMRSRLVAAGTPDAWLENEAYVNVLLGDFNAAMDALERAAKTDPGTREHAASLPWFDPLKSNPRFRAFIGR